MASPKKQSYLFGGTFNSVAPILIDGDLSPFQLDSAGNLLVNINGGTLTFTGTVNGNPAAGLTGAAVPTSADYLGINIGGLLVGQTGVSLTNAKAAAVAIVDGNGNQITSFGGGTQYADSAASGATPTGTLSMGWDSANSKVRALKVDASQNLLVDVANASIAVTGTFWQVTQPVSLASLPALAAGSALVGGVEIYDGAGTNKLAVNASGQIAISNFPATQPVSGTVAVTQSTNPWVVQDNADYIDNAASGATPLGQLMMGWDSTNSKIRALKVDATQNLLVDVANTVAVSGSVSVSNFPSTVDVTDRAARLLGVVYGSQGQKLLQTPTNFNTQVELATGATLYDARQIRALTSADIVSAVQSTNPWVISFTAPQHVIVDSGAITVSGTVTGNQGSPNTLANSWPFEITDGTHGPVAVKAASTAVVAADPALVVGISQNTPVIIAASTGAAFTANNSGSFSTALDVNIIRVGGSTLTGPAGIPISGDGVHTMPSGDVIARSIFEQITDGVNGPVAVKAPSIAALATDPALVVAISPNSSVAVSSSGTLVTSDSTTQADIREYKRYLLLILQALNNLNRAMNALPVEP